MKTRLVKMLCCTVAVFLLSLSAVTAYATQETTIGDLEDLVVDYTEEYHPLVEYGSPEYADFLMEQLVGDTEVEFEKLDNYADVVLYATEYIYQRNNAPLSSFDADGTFILPESVRSLTPVEFREIDDEDIAQDERLYQLASARNSVSQLSVNYDAEAAAEYAVKWAKTRNDAYNDFSLRGGDCTNFTSQALVAGGIDMNIPSPRPAGTSSSTDYWYSVKYYYPGAIAPSYDVSSSFIGVEDFYDYMVNNAGASSQTVYSIESLQENAQLGDVVQLRDSGGHYYHNIIIAGEDEDGWTYCAHSRDRRDKTIWYLDSSDNSAYRILSFN